MTTPSYQTSIFEHWVNDHLDLYNYAQSVGDTAWQEEIMSSLKRKDTLIHRELKRAARYTLWRKFDDINLHMLDLYQQLKAGPDDEQAEDLRKQVLDLRMERLEVVKQLHIGMLHNNK